MNTPDMELMNEQLTAYLDGELSNEEAAELERRLVEDEPLRLKLAELRRAYELLDELPETPYNQRFTQSTLELVVKDLTDSQIVKGTSQPQTTTAALEKKIDWWGWPRVLLLATGFLVIGALLGLGIRFMQFRQDIRDLGLIANMPGLIDVSDLNVAVNLSQEKAALSVLSEQWRDRLIPPTPASMWQRKNWMDSLSALHHAKLESGRESLRKLDRESYNRLSAIESQIEQRPDSETLQEAIHIVGMVMDSLPNSRRLDLDGMNQEERTLFLKDQLYLSAAMSYAHKILPEEATALDKWENAFFKPALGRELQVPITKLMDTKTMLGILWFRRPIENGFEMLGQQELVAELMPQLSEQGKAILDGVAKRDQFSVLVAWMMPSRVASTKIIVEEYERVPRDIREGFDLGDPQQTRRRVEEGLFRRNNRGRRP